MYLGEVRGTVVATQKYEGLAGAKLLLVQPVNRYRRAVGGPEVAVDTVQAGVGDFVFLVGSREAALALDPWFVPVDAAIVGIVDAVGAGEPLPDPDTVAPAAVKGSRTNR
jgi:ethanolamine utilization protein EutN